MSAHAENGQAIVPAGRVDAVHFLAAVEVPGWNGPLRLKAIVCGSRVGHDPDRFTAKPRNVTCADCRMHPAFAAARGGV